MYKSLVSVISRDEKKNTCILYNSDEYIFLQTNVKQKILGNNFLDCKFKYKIRYRTIVRSTLHVYSSM